MKRTEYSWKTQDIPGFLAQIVRYVGNGGTYFYFRGVVPKGKNPDLIADKLLTRYAIRKRKWQRTRRQLKDTASIHYLGYGRLFVVMLEFSWSL